MPKRKAAPTEVPAADADAAEPAAANAEPETSPKKGKEASKKVAGGRGRRLALSDEINDRTTSVTEFSSVELRAVIKFLFLQKKTPKEIHECMLQTLTDKCPSYSTVRKWCANFQRGDFETEDATRSGRPATVSTPEIVDHVYDLILADPNISARTIAKTLDISSERVGFIIHEHLGLRKL